MRQKICEIKSLKNLSGKEFLLENVEIKQDAFLIYFNEHCYAYENSCPHTGVNLNWQKGQFFSLDGLYLQCSLHGALFEPDTGLCIRGPCKGERLKKMTIVIENGVVFNVK